MTERYYDPHDPRDKEYQSTVYRKATAFIPEYLLHSRYSHQGCAYLGDIRVSFEEKYPDLCDDTILRSETSRQPKWKHCIDLALQNMKKQGVLIGGREVTEKELWCLAQWTAHPEPDERFVTSGSTRLWSTVSGQGTPLLMFNGGPGCDDYMGPVADMIDDLCRVVRFEPRGCGRSDWDSNYDLDTLLTDAEVVRREYGLEKCIVAGHSSGPNVALAYALRHPSRVMGLIGIAGGNVLNDRTWSEAYHKGLEEVGEDRGGHEDKADPAVNPDGNRSWREYIKRPTLFREIADFDKPAIFINGGQDIRPNWPTQQLASLMPRGRYVEIPDAAHTIWLTHATELKHELLRAVRQIVESTQE